MPPRTLIFDAEGRDLEVVTQGDASGVLLVFHHGSPSAAVASESLGAMAQQHGIHLVTYSRPGFGKSTRHPGRTVASCAADVAAIADHLDAQRFLTAGWSGGGPHAIATAALLPNRVAAAVTLAGVAPYDAAGLDWTAGMGEDNQIEYPLAARDPDALLGWMQPHVGPRSDGSARPCRMVDRSDTYFKGETATGLRTPIAHRPHRRDLRRPARERTAIASIRWTRAAVAAAR